MMHPDVKKTIDDSIGIGCCIITPIRFGTIMVKDMGEGFDTWSKLPPTAMVLHNTEKGTWGTRIFEENNLKNPICSHSEIEGETIIADYNGEVYYLGLGNNKHWEKNGIPQRGIKALKNIHGTIYAAGLMRSIFRRDGKDQWTHLSEDLSEETQKTKDAISNKSGKHLWTGFDCIDGFEAHKDLYAAGGNGDVWRYNGSTWLSVDIPLPKRQISGICCASDGFVYIVGRFGTIVKGREDYWEILKHDFAYDFSDVVDYKGKIYIASPRRLFVIENNQLSIVHYEAKLVPANHGHLYVNHGLLMTAGRSSAAIFDGEHWKVLFGGAYLDEETSQHVLETVIKKAIENE